MPELLSPLPLIRGTARLIAGAVRIGTAPARAAISVAELLVEEATDALRPHEPLPDPTPPSAVPFVGEPAPPADGASGPPSVTPSIARAPARKRRRTVISHPRQPVVMPDLPDAAEPPAEPAPGPFGEPEPASAPARRDGAQPEPVSAPGREAEAQPEPAARAGAEAHVSAGETLVAEVADPGAEDGAGAQVRIEEPWPDYRRMAAGEIVDRISVEDEAALTVVLLYERAHRARKTVIAAAEQALARAG